MGWVRQTLGRNGNWVGIFGLKGNLGLGLEVEVEWADGVGWFRIYTRYTGYIHNFVNIVSLYFTKL